MVSIRSVPSLVFSVYQLFTCFHQILAKDRVVIFRIVGPRSIEFAHLLVGLAENPLKVKIKALKLNQLYINFRSSRYNDLRSLKRRRAKPDPGIVGKSDLLFRHPYQIAVDLAIAILVVPNKNRIKPPSPPHRKRPRCCLRKDRPAPHNRREDPYDSIRRKVAQSVALPGFPNPSTVMVSGVEEVVCQEGIPVM